MSAHGDTLSDRERKLILHFGMVEEALEVLSPVGCYDVAMKYAFTNPERFDDKYIQVLRTCVTEITNVTTYRATPEWEALLETLDE